MSPKLITPPWAAGRPIPQPVIKGDRVTLRPFDNKDTPMFIDSGTDPHVTDTFYVMENGGEQHALRSIALMQQQAVLGKALSYAVTDSDDVAVGYLGMGLGNIVHGRVIIGMWIRPSHQQKGYMTAGMQTAVEWLSQQEGVRRIEAFIAADNTASRRGVEKAGLNFEAVLHRWEMHNGEPRDMCSYALLVD